MPAGPRPRAPALRYGLALGALLACCGFVLLGNWQVARRAWKLELVAQVQMRLAAAPAAAPDPAQWPLLGAARDEYRRVHVSGRLWRDRQTLVQAVTELGSGYWVLAPLRTPAGAVILVNRGFVPPGWQDSGGAGDSPPVTISGLLRMSEPGGGFLRRNDPAAGRWYSRDVAAIAAARGLGPVAPYFIDADADTSAGGGGAPVGGLTVVRFSNNHLVYAITWYALALIAAALLVGVLRPAHRAAPGAGRIGAGPADTR